MASIYNIQTWLNSQGAQGPYKKNDIVKTSDGKYWYATTDHNSVQTPSLSTSEWGGNISLTVGGVATTNPYFFWAPAYNLTASHQPKVVELSFADGYEQRLKDGINNDLLNLSLSFENRNEREATAIVHFLQQKQAYKPFFFKTPSPYSLIKKFICKNWSVQVNYDDNLTVQADFVEVS